MKKMLFRPQLFSAVFLVMASVASLTSCANHPSPNKRPDTESETELWQLYDRLMRASKNKDEKALREILSDDYSQVTADGVLRDKEKRIKDTLSAVDTMSSFSIEDFRPRLYSDTAVATCRVRMQGVDHGEHYDAAVLSTATFVRKDGKWQIAATHLTFPPKDH